MKGSAVAPPLQTNSNKLTMVITSGKGYINNVACEDESMKDSRQSTNGGSLSLSAHYLQCKTGPRHRWVTTLVNLCLDHFFCWDEYFACVYVCMLTTGMPGTFRNQRRTLDSPGSVEYHHVDVGTWTWVLFKSNMYSYLVQGWLLSNLPSSSPPYWLN